MILKVDAIDWCTMSLKRYGLSFCALVWYCQPAISQEVLKELDYSAAIRKLEIAVRMEVEQKQLPAFSLSLVDRDRVVLAQGFGFQDAEKKVPATAETVYRVGSVSKLFTDIAVMQLVEKGQLDLDAPIAVVGSVLESQGNIAHSNRVRESILDPLGMMDSSFDLSPIISAKLATGWMRTYDGRRFRAPEFQLGTGPAGNMFSSVLDLSKFLTCIFNEGRVGNRQILQSDTLARMTTPIRDAKGESQGFGLGFSIGALDGFKKIGHGGAVYGFSTQLEAIPDRKIGVAAAASLDGCNGAITRLVSYALRLMLAVQDGKLLPEFQSTTRIAPERAQELVGVYRDQTRNRFARIAEWNGSVFMQNGEYRYELRATADGSVVTDDCTGFGTKVVLAKSDELLVGGNAYKRLEDVPPSDIPDRWKGLIGEYGWDHNTLYVLEDQGELFVLIEWLYYYPLTEVSDNEFRFPSTGLYHGEGLRFVRNSDGVATDVVAAEVTFKRREVGTKDGETFKIVPLKPIEELRATATNASPPKEQGEFFATDLIEPNDLDESIQLDIRYATNNNFTGSTFYRQSRAFLQRPAAEAVVRIHRSLANKGVGLLIHDAYRPWSVTKMFWDATPDDLRTFVANPANGSRHNRGCAVDLSLYDLANGEPIQMVAGYDEFSPRSYPFYPGGTSRQRWYRELLRRSMEAEGFQVYEFEWWHFDYKDWKKYRIGNVEFEDLLPSRE